MTSRRKMLAGLAAAPVAARAQVGSAPAPAADPEFTGARQRIQASLEAIRKVQVPASLEPTFRFEAE